jgi:hypothetical protein
MFMAKILSALFISKCTLDCVTVIFEISVLQRMPPGFLLCSTGNKTLRIENNTIRNPLKKKMSVLYKNSARTAQ